MMRPSAIAAPIRTASADAGGTLYSTDVICDMNCTGSDNVIPPSPWLPRSCPIGLRRAGLRYVRTLEAGDVGDLPFALLGPTDAHSRSGCRGVGGSRVERVEHRGVGAVELHERP